MKRMGIDSVRAKIAKVRDTVPVTSWRRVALLFPGVPAATLCAIYKHGREPHGAGVRHALGLPDVAPAPVCPVHGKVHSHVHKPRPSYDEWRAANMPTLLAMVAWAEGER